MFGVFIVLLDFSKSLARDRRKCLFLNDELCMVRPTLINMNPNGLNIIHIMSYLQKYVFQKKQNTYMLKHLV